MNEEESAGRVGVVSTLSPDKLLKNLVLQRRAEFLDHFRYEEQKSFKGVNVSFFASRSYLLALYREVKTGYLRAGLDDLEAPILSANPQDLPVLFDEIESYLWNVGITRYEQKKNSEVGGIGPYVE